MAQLAVPYYTRDGALPESAGAGVLGFWLIILFGLSYFLRQRISGERRWRISTTAF